jgi:predicted DNA-binding protein (UPF0251 family)
LARPSIPRHIGFVPGVVFFKPAGVRLRDIEVVLLGLEELEALRLKDGKGFDQETCAQHMRVSRPTFQRILQGARRKVAIALTQGKAIRVEGSIYHPQADLAADELEIHAMKDGVCPHCDTGAHAEPDEDDE